MSQVKCTIIAPYDVEGARIRETIIRALREMNISTFDLDKIRPGALLTNSIIDSIQSSDFLIVDISRLNPNVFYELGYAHALRKPTILIMSSDSTGSIPSDLQGYQFIMYDKGNLSGLRERIIQYVSHFTKEQKR